MTTEQSTDILATHGHLIIPEPNSGCWLWLGDTNLGGYGQMKVGGKHRSTHRYSYQMSVGPIPDGMQIDHLCYVRCCVNPAHLEAVTQLENTRRASDMRIRLRGNRCCHGHELSEPFPRNERGFLRCRKCIAMYDRNRRARRRALKSSGGE